MMAMFQFVLVLSERLVKCLFHGSERKLRGRRKCIAMSESKAALEACQQREVSTVVSCDWGDQTLWIVQQIDLQAGHTALPCKFPELHEPPILTPRITFPHYQARLAPLGQPKPLRHTASWQHTGPCGGCVALLRRADKPAPCYRPFRCGSSPRPRQLP